jgi:hypothetical protein
LLPASDVSYKESGSWSGVSGREPAPVKKSIFTDGRRCQQTPQFRAGTLGQ